MYIHCYGIFHVHLLNAVRMVCIYCYKRYSYMQIIEVNFILISLIHMVLHLIIWYFMFKYLSRLTSPKLYVFTSNDCFFFSFFATSQLCLRVFSIFNRDLLQFLLVISDRFAVMHKMHKFAPISKAMVLHDPNYHAKCLSSSSITTLE